MELLFKYYALSKYSKKNFKDDVVLFNNILGFNDPFEGIGRFLYDVSPEEQEYWNNIGSDLPKGIAKRIATDSRESLIFANRILCVTEKYDHPLMWAHYAQSHTGFCIGYSKDDIKEISNRFDKVTYQSHPHNVNMESIDKDEIESLLYFKSDAWLYEEEWRAVYTLSNEDVRHLDYNNNFDKCFQPYENSCKFYMARGYAQMNNLEVLESEKYILKSCKPQVVYLGLRMKQEEKQDIIAIGKEKNLKIFQMTQSPNSYEMSAYEI